MKNEKSSEKAPRESRRRFTKAALAALAAAPAGLAAAQTPTPSPPESKAPPNPQPTPAPQAQAQPPQTTPVGEAYAEVARARFGKQLSPEELARVKRDLEGNVRAADRLRAHKLQNSDEPDFVFGA